MASRGNNVMQPPPFRGLPWSREALEWLGAIATASVLIGLLIHRPGVLRLAAAAVALSLLILAATFLSGLTYCWRTRGAEPSLGWLGLAAIGSLALASALARVALQGWAVLLGNPVWVLAASGVCFVACLGGTVYLLRAGHAGEA